MTYVDGFVVAVPTEKRETYRQFAEKAAAVFKEFGALKCVELDIEFDMVTFERTEEAGE